MMIEYSQPLSFFIISLMYRNTLKKNMFQLNSYHHKFKALSPSPCLYTFTLKLCLLNNSNSMSFPLKKSKNTCLKSKLFIDKERVDIFLNHTSGKNMTEKKIVQHYDLKMENLTVIVSVRNKKVRAVSNIKKPDKTLT